MQAIARANRVNEGKKNGLIVDYCGILKNLRKALATFAGTSDAGHGGGAGEQDPARPEEELLAGPRGSHRNGPDRSCRSVERHSTTS